MKNSPLRGAQMRHILKADGKMMKQSSWLMWREEHEQLHYRCTTETETALKNSAGF